MKKILLLFILFMPLKVLATPTPDIYSREAIVYDLTDNLILYEKNSNIPISVASLTKILTVLTAIENAKDLDARITVTSNMLSGIYWNASVAGLKAGDIVTFRDLLYGTLLPSGADAAQVLAISVSGSTSAFITKMNELAVFIGMNNSHFTTITGLDDDGQFSTAKDIAKLLKYALKNETFKKVYTTRNYKFTNGLNVSSTLNLYEEKSGLDTKRIIGSKTGTTKNAGLCLASYFKSNNHDMIIVTIGAPYPNDNFYNLVDNLNLISYIDDNYEELSSELKPVTETITASTITNENLASINNLNYKTYIFIGVVIVLFFIIVVPRKTKKRRKK